MDYLKLEDILEDLLDDENLENFLINLTEKARVLLGAERCTLFIYNPEDESLKTVVFQADMKEKVTIYLRDKTIAGYVFKNQVVVNITDVTNDEELRTISNELYYHECWKNVNVSKTKSMLSIPVVIKGESIGVITAVNKFPNFTKEDEQLGIYLSKIFGYALKNFLKKLELINLNKLNEIIISSINEGIVITDSNDSILQVNDKFLEMLGYRYRYEDVVGKNVFDILPILRYSIEKIRLVKDKKVSQDFIAGIIKIKVIPIYLNHFMDMLLKNLVYIIEY